MLFSTSVFLIIFLPLVLIFYYNPFFKNRVYRNIVLLFFGFIFYAWGEPVFVFLMLFSIMITWLLTRQMERQNGKTRKAYFSIIVCYNILILFVFKYLSFLLKEVSYLLFGEIVEKMNIEISLPLGISFFTFQILSYVFDVYYKKISAQASLYKFSLYVSMFPQLVAGPIVRYTTIADEIDNRKETWQDIGYGGVRFIYGLSKKVLLANSGCNCR